jgi:hypothetical protein
MSVCMYYWLIRHANRNIISSCVVYPAVPYTYALSHILQDFRGEKIIEHKICILIFSTTFVRYFSHSKKNSARYRKCTKKIFSCKVPAFLVMFQWNLNFSRHIFEIILKYQISWKSVQWETSCSMRTDRWTDMTLNSRIYKFCDST